MPLPLTDNELQAPRPVAVNVYEEDEKQVVALTVLGVSMKKPVGYQMRTTSAIEMPLEVVKVMVTWVFWMLGNGLAMVRLLVVVVPCPVGKYGTWFVAVPVPPFDVAVMKTVLGFRAAAAAADIWIPARVMTTSVPVKVPNGLNEAARVMAVPENVGVTSVCKLDATAPPMLNLLMEPVKDVPVGNVMVSFDANADKVANEEKVTVKVEHA